MWKICLAKPTLTWILFIIALIVLSNGVSEPHDANTKIRTQLQHIVGNKNYGATPCKGSAGRAAAMIRRVNSNNGTKVSIEIVTLENDPGRG